MSNFFYPEKYKSFLGVYDTQVAIGYLKRFFEDKLAAALNLIRVSAPLFVDPKTGLNDDLNGVERAVNFDIKETGKEAHIVHSLAKWKRQALQKYGFPVGQGLYTDMNAIRRDEEMDNLHSIYVDQWDWEKVIRKEDRNLAFLKRTVQRIYEAVKVTENKLFVEFPQIVPELPDEIKFIHSEELVQMYPGLGPKERENAIVEKYGAVFIIGIGGVLSDGKAHDGRASDYDDWSTPNEDGYLGLNGDLLVWNNVLGRAFELSSMGIRVDETALRKQLAIKGEEYKAELLFHRQLLAGELPYTIGGGIGQSRLCMYLLRKAHIGEIQSSLWPEEMREACELAGIQLV